MIKINLTQARKLDEVTVCGDKVSPESMFAIKVSGNTLTKQWLNAFLYYNHDTADKVCYYK